MGKAMTAEEKRGRYLLFGGFAVLLIFMIAYTGFLIVESGVAITIPFAIALCVLSGLAVLVWIGHGWARRLMSGFLILFAALMILGFLSGHPRFIQLGAAAVALIPGLLMTLNKSVS